MKTKPDWGLRTIVFIFGVVPGLVITAWLVGMFISVVYLGGSDACPQNLCP